MISNACEASPVGATVEIELEINTQFVRICLDPATSSAPFVATLVDVTGLVIYFAVAGVILQGTLL